ncbi:glycosyl transferase family 2 [Flagellimonas aquimarina]|uniref:Glycosyl transferase family 2 n=1 Tax=Flagellimonas aquimarina TaxID=2201895 RepID=A0A316L261_9FLAO|nr:glycosyltransferase family 2 protein [Allomuricauda koreensis]PWL39035.1 glycosyl transferase family 2 [Allomuricauda koreensis]
MQNPRVSILIPFKNTAHFLPECLDSILEQTYSNWEVLAINDHSDDGSLDLLTLYAKKDQRIKVFKNKGQGIIPALRTAYKNSSGDYITRMDSDDIMKPNRLDVMVKSLIENGEGHVAVGKVKYFSERGVSNGYARYESWLNKLTQVGKNYDEIYKECVIPSPCWMTFKKDLELCGAFEPDRYPEDYDLTFRFYENGLKVIPCSETLHLWRDYDSRTSRTSEHYAQNYFLELKLHYFLRLDYDKNRPLVIWGAGFKGKSVAKLLLKADISFVWLCDNPKKIGKKIYGKELVHFKTLEELESPQSIITVANEQAQNEIKDFLNRTNQLPMQDFFFFC